MRTSLLRICLAAALLVSGCMLSISPPTLKNASGAPQLLSFWQDGRAAVFVLALFPLLLLVAVVVVLLEMEFGPAALARGDLDNLLRLKRRGPSLQRSPRLREMSARVRRHAMTVRRAAAVPTPAGTGLDQPLTQLLQLKRDGALSPPR